MAYKIQYSQETAYRYPQTSSKRTTNWGKWFGIALILAAVLWMRLNGIPDFLIPGDPAVTKAAAVTLVDELRNNIPIGEAVTTFCESILDGANF